MAKPNYPVKKKSNSTYKTAGVVILILVIIAAALLIFKSCSGEPLAADPTPNGGIVYDDNAVQGGWDEADAVSYTHLPQQEQAVRSISGV